MRVEMVSREEITQLADEWCRQMCGADPDGFARLLAEDCVIHGLTDKTIRGSADVVDLFQRLMEIYPDKDCRVQDAVVEGDKIACRWVMTFASGPPSSRMTNGVVDGITIFVARDQRIVELWTNFGRWWV
jgi:hypothetical protein